MCAMLRTATIARMRAYVPPTRIGMWHLVVGVLLVAASGGSAAGAPCARTRDPSCIQACRSACKDANPCGDGGFDKCIGMGAVSALDRTGCAKQPNCAGIVTCVKDCYGSRAAANARCRRYRQACTQHCCRHQCAPLPRALTVSVIDEACLQKCRTVLDKCRKDSAGQTFDRNVCVGKCDPCGEFREFPQALKICLSNCPDPPDNTCGSDFQDCKAGCMVSTTATGTSKRP